MHAVVGTVPDKDFPLVTGEVGLDGDVICIRGNRIPVNRGTAALLASMIKAGEYLGQQPPHAFLAGDIGLGDGSRHLYEYLVQHLGVSSFRSIIFHYLQPDVDRFNRMLFVIEEMTHAPILIADAGSMYVAKMSGHSQAFDLFTPDIGELAFLADEEAPHPFYTRGFILHEENRVPELISRSYEHENAARNLLVKGERDYVANEEGVLATIDHPVDEALEAIGGTGDSLTGIVACLIGAGMEISEAAAIAAQVNRVAGHLAQPTAATQVIEIINCIPRALEKLFSENDRIREWPKTHQRKSVASTPKSRY